MPLTPLIARLARRYPITRANGVRQTARHAALAAGVSVLEVAFYTVLRWVLDVTVLHDAYDPGAFFVSTLLRSLLFDMLFYAVIMAVVQVLDAGRTSQRREVEVARLERQLTEAQLRALRMQLNPHFLFNTLHTISAILERDASGARRMMTDLSDLLRASLDGSNRPFVTLRQEEQFVRRYLRIEQERLQERLTVRFEIDEACRDALVPHLILQPLVENAIKHGIAPHARAGALVISADCANDVLTLRVHDDGPGAPGGWTTGRPTTGHPRAHPTAGPGIGLPTTRERLERLYGDDAALTVVEREGEGVTVVVRLPFCTDVLDAAEEPALA